jgi:hypothetical protein
MFSIMIDQGSEIFREKFNVFSHYFRRPIENPFSTDWQWWDIPRIPNPMNPDDQASWAMSRLCVPNPYSYANLAYSIAYEPLLGEIKHDDDVIAIVTKNRYNSAVLNALELFAADIDVYEHDYEFDFKDRNESDFEQKQQAVLDGLRSEFGEKEGRFRLYRTTNGFRLLRLDAPMIANSPDSIALMQRVGTDRRYIEICMEQRVFRARLTPKPWRAIDGSEAVCQLVAEIGSAPIYAPFEAALAAHDRCVGIEGQAIA